ncbi:MAG: transcription-repair coupling factor, partial [Gammaproteobacteria bacterium]|nr:transcription-repair coupling factor [Gammaproteobacteria bacterium]
QDIISTRLETLYRLPDTQKGILLVPIAMLLQKVVPPSFLNQHSLILDIGDRIQIDAMRLRLEHSGYRCVPQVVEHGEFAVRGSILDLFPAGQKQPIRIDLFDDEIESIRIFDAETQRTQEKTDKVRLLPAREFPFDQTAINNFKQNYRHEFEGDPSRSMIYRDVGQAIMPSGIEYYFPLFFSEVATLFDFFPKNTVLLEHADIEQHGDLFLEDVEHRYEQRRHDIERPILPPAQLFLNKNQLQENFSKYQQIRWQNFAWAQESKKQNRFYNLSSAQPPSLTFDVKLENTASKLQQFLNAQPGRVLFAAETEGRREILLELLRDKHINPHPVNDWQAFLASDFNLAITVAPLEQGLYLKDLGITIIAEPQLFGDRVQQRRRRKRAGTHEHDAIIKNLTELNIGSPVVHQDHGVGRYLGLEKLDLGNAETEFLSLEYAEGDKLYVPVASLHLISRYTGVAPENAPLHRLGSDIWEKTKRKAAEQARDVAAELLEVYARREAAKGEVFSLNKEDYTRFAEKFPFEETPDQEAAIENVVKDLTSVKPMDRVVCGDVGFGKTEVAMRAAFITANDSRQVAVLVPTTLLAQQHYQNFRDRFADWPIRVEVLSRFKSKKEQDAILKDISNAKVDIVIGTHKLLGDSLKFSNLGLVIVDEEHRFGVRQKEKLKTLCANVNLLTLTATPIPRTLNMSLAGLRDLSLIATPPTQRLAVKTFVGQWNDATLSEALQREIKRGGQVYFLHNEVESIERIARDVQVLLPEASVEIAHGQMRERDLEQVMLDFYHRRFNVLVCTTIIESGIDVPTANTIIINRADKLGLAQLHQLRGRVGRSHHRAYAYLLTPHKKLITTDAQKRLEAIESLEDLGAGFMLATHDLEIRGAGELLGEDQSGQIQQIGFTLYSELLERAVKALKSGKQPELDRPLDHGAEVNLNIPALIPEEYLPDVHSRLTLYKRIASAESNDELKELQVEMIDRFGLLPDALKSLIAITEIKLKANPLGIHKIDLNTKGGRIIFNSKPNVDPMSIIQLMQSKPTIYKLDGPDKLRINKHFEKAEQRIPFLNETLSRLQISN